MIQIKNGLISSTEGKTVHQIGTERYFTLGGAKDDDRPEDFEEVDSEPPYREYEYREQVQQLIARRYSLADEIAIERQRETKPEQWQEHFDYCEQCKVEAKELLSKKKEAIK